jgi:hypothetical protein
VPYQSLAIGAGAPVIVVEGTLWPVVILGAVDDASTARRDALIVTDELLEMSQALAIGVVVAGTGDVGVRAQHGVLAWLEAHEQLLMSRTLRLAWIIDDARIRACTNAWLRCMGQTLFTVQSVTFQTLQAALPWLLDTPWPVGAAFDRRDRTERRTEPPIMAKQRTVRLVSRSR